MSAQPPVSNLTDTWVTTTSRKKRNTDLDFRSLRATRDFLARIARDALVKWTQREARVAARAESLPVKWKYPRSYKSNPDKRNHLEQEVRRIVAGIVAWQNIEPENLHVCIRSHLHVGPADWRPHMTVTVSQPQQPASPTYPWTLHVVFSSMTENRPIAEDYEDPVPVWHERDDRIVFAYATQRPRQHCFGTIATAGNYVLSLSKPRFMAAKRPEVREGGSGLSELRGLGTQGEYTVDRVVRAGVYEAEKLRLTQPKRFLG